MQAAPFAKTGGLGDVCGSLPKALAKRGHRVMVVLPRYDAYEGASFTGVCLLPSEFCTDGVPLHRCYNVQVLQSQTDLSLFSSYHCCKWSYTRNECCYML